MKSLLALVAGAAILATPVYDALACGACFAPPSSPTVVSGHRMVMSISPEQTVLWDQIQYQGSPEDFAWVLPVKPGAPHRGGDRRLFRSARGDHADGREPAPGQLRRRQLRRGRLLRGRRLQPGLR